MFGRQIKRISGVDYPDRYKIFTAAHRRPTSRRESMNQRRSANSYTVLSRDDFPVKNSMNSLF
jgi:hypothetical protein